MRAGTHLLYFTCTFHWNDFFSIPVCVPFLLKYSDLAHLYNSVTLQRTNKVFLTCSIAFVQVDGWANLKLAWACLELAWKNHELIETVLVRVVVHLLGRLRA